MGFASRFASTSPAALSAGVRSDLVRFPNPLALPRASESENLTRSDHVLYDDFYDHKWWWWWSISHVRSYFLLETGKGGCTCFSVCIIFLLILCIFVSFDHSCLFHTSLFSKKAFFLQVGFRLDANNSSCSDIDECANIGKTLQNNSYKIWNEIYLVYLNQECRFLPQKIFMYLLPSFHLRARRLFEHGRILFLSMPFWIHAGDQINPVRETIMIYKPSWSWSPSLPGRRRSWSW